MTDISNEIPETIDYDETEVNDMNSKPVLKEGWFKFLVTGHRKAVSKKGNLMRYLDCKPLAEDDSPFSQVASYRIMPPKANPNVPGHQKPNTALGCVFFAMSLDPSFPWYAKKVPDSVPTQWKTRDGDLVDKAGSDAIAKEVDKAVAKVTKDWWNNPDMLLDEVFFGRIEHNEGTDGKTYANIERTRAEAPEDEPVLYSDIVG